MAGLPSGDGPILLTGAVPSVRLRALAVCVAALVDGGCTVTRRPPRRARIRLRQRAPVPKATQIIMGIDNIGPDSTRICCRISRR